jgi:RimJ/RimL family protein N-acetyltransferase
VKTTYPQIETHGLVLREWASTDLAVMQTLFDDPEIASRTPLESPFDAAAALRYLTRAHEAHDRHQRTHWAITTDGKQAQGEVLLNRTTGSIGYIVGAAHRGQRLAARALRAVVEYAHAQLDLPRLILEIEPSNQPSIAVARSAGFHATASQPETVTDKGRTYTLDTWEHTPDHMA